MITKTRPDVARPSLLVKARRGNAEIVNVTPAFAGWKYVGFAAYRMAAGAFLDFGPQANELCIVVLEGTITVAAGGATWRDLGERRSVFEDRSPYAVYLPEGEPLYPPDYLTDRPERFFAAEIVREKLLQFTHAELPFSTAVVIDRFEEPEQPKGLMKLYCTIVVDRDSQKPIILGRGGEMIKKIGIAAREDLEKFFDTRVFLDLHVRVKSEWREDENVLNDIGLG